MRLFALLAALVGVGASGCDTPCKKLGVRLCACDLTRERNRKACDAAGDTTNRRQSERLARQTGVDPEAICRAALDAFHCPEETARR